MYNLLQYCFKVVAAGLLATTAHAIGVSPTLIEISPDLPIANLTLSNEQDTPVTMQINLVTWTQQQEEEIYKPTDELVVTPRIFTMAPHSAQLVRIGFEKPLFKDKEIAYRLFAEEVLPKVIKKNTLRVALRFSIPIIIKPLSPLRQQVFFQVKRKGNQWAIKAVNSGNNVVFINQLQTLSDKQIPLSADTQTFAYLLPGNHKMFYIQQNTSQYPSLVKASINNQVVLEHVT